MYDKLPQPDEIQVFGCLNYVSRMDSNESKFSTRARKCPFLGYKSGVKGYIAYDFHCHHIVVSRLVDFEELIFPYSSNSYPASSTTWKYMEHSDLHCSPFIPTTFVDHPPSQNHPFGLSPSL